MEIKVGQWARTNETDFFEIILYLGKLHANNEKYVTSIPINALDIIKVADIPQELIQVGDLVDDVYKNGITQVDEIGDNRVETNAYSYDYSEITKIYTPNKDESQYTLQWEANNV